MSTEISKGKNERKYLLRKFRTLTKLLRQKNKNFKYVQKEGKKFLDAVKDFAAH